MHHPPAGARHRQHSSEWDPVGHGVPLHVVAPPTAAPTAGCPPWCTFEHLGEGSDSCGFHHDGEVTTLNLIAAACDGAPVDLFVNVSQHVRVGGQVEEPHVEVQDAYRTLALLTPDEAVALAAALLAPARVVGGEPSATC